jgi:CheY-like chemotaxis protein
MHISETNLSKTLKNLYDFFKPQAEQKKLKFILRNHLPPELSIINTDRAKLNSILTNLIKNAINYTDSGKIEIGCISRNNFIEYYVSDTGIGISRSKHAVIFNRFEQADIYDTKAIQGSGLGLSIAKAYVEMLGGKIRLESEEGLGSTFYFTVPLNPGETKKIMQQKQESTPKEGIPQIKDKKILITEDDEFSMEMMVYMLEKTNCELLKARDGLKAVEIFQKEHVDLVLLDIQLPGMNGYEVLRQIRSIDPRVPVIAQTAYAMLDVVQKIKDSGFTNYILKPASPQQLYSLITKHLTLPDIG